MEKQITITIDDNGKMNFDYSGFNSMEVLGILRFWEKQTYSDIITLNKPNNEVIGTPNQS